MRRVAVEDKGGLGRRHRPSGLNTDFPHPGSSFVDYVQRMQSMLWQVHEGKSELETIVAGNSPFELHPTGDFQRGRNKPFRRGVLLTHGLSDSPYHMRHLAAFFQRQGFRVMAILLPGHGTRPGDLLEVRWQEWTKVLAYGADCLAAEVDELYLAGFSAGAALSVFHAAQDDRVCGLFLYSPAFEIASRARWANLHRLYSWLVPQEAWLSVLPDLDLYKYESFCKNAAAQMYALTQALPRDGLDIPVFAAASADDATVHSAATLRFMQRASHPLSHLVWYATESIGQDKVEWVDSALPEQRILSCAHTAIVMSPEDEHYGAAGDYVNCLHYYESNGGRYIACLTRPQEAWMGEILPQHLQRGLLRRLMYNPHYAAMETSMQRFIEGLP